MNYFPINHIGCIVDCMMPCLVAGGTQVMIEQFDPTVSLELIARERVTLWGSVPSVFQMQLALPDFGRFDLASVQLIAWGGAAGGFSPRAAAAFRGNPPRHACGAGRLGGCKQLAPAVLAGPDHDPRRRHPRRESGEGCSTLTTQCVKTRPPATSA
jgi:acyl-CoA synthetase (AMP-forming)/AMP-acid ligase II